jgi:glycosyltransferase involved in cell wall biosynthesis
MKCIGLLYPTEEPISPANWSGIPHGMAEGFTALGIEPVPIPCRLPHFIRLGLSLIKRVRRMTAIIAHREPFYVKARSVFMANALRRPAHLDAVVAMGCDLYDLSFVTRERSIPVATYEDGNYTLFLRYKDSDVCRSGYPIKAVKKWAERQAMACKRADIALASTAWAKRSIIEDFGVPENKVRVVGIGHHPRCVSPEDRDWTSPRFLFVGVSWKRKNGEAVVGAFSRIRERFPDATLDLAGRHPVINVPGVTGHGHLYREDPYAQKKLDNLFAKATAFVLPSLFEPAGIAYLEAASAGLPVIGTNCGGAADLLGEAAISVDPYDREALIRAMLQVCDRNVARSMGARALAQAENSTWKAVSARIANSFGLIRI